MFSRINSCINSNCNRKRVHYFRICTLIGHSVIQIVGVENIRFFSVVLFDTFVMLNYY